jgi:hypothetical protein
VNGGDGLEFDSEKAEVHTGARWEIVRYERSRYGYAALLATVVFLYGTVAANLVP